MSKCPYIKGNICDIAKCDEFHMRADEQAKCETCIHKVTKADIDAIEDNARVDEREKFAKFALSAFVLLFTKEELLEQFEDWCNYHK